MKFCQIEKKSIRAGILDDVEIMKIGQDFNSYCKQKELQGPPMLFDKTNFGLVIYNQANFYRFEETSSYWLVKRISVFLCFSVVNQ